MNGKGKLKKLLLLAATMVITGLVHRYLSTGPSVINKGLPLGLTKNADTWMVWLILCLLTGRWWFSNQNGWWILLLAGGWINLGDRINIGGVTDYWTMPGLGLKNNLPDWLIFLGVLGIIYNYWLQGRGVRGRT